MVPALARTPWQAPHQRYSEGDLKLESGDAIKDFSISYVNHGTLNARKSSGCFPADNEFLNRETRMFLDGLTDGGKKLD